MYQNLLTTLSALYLTFFEDGAVYENLKIGSGSLLSVRLIVIGLFVGIALAGFGSVFNKRVLGDFVRKLLGEECLDGERAKTLEELGFAQNFFIRYSVARGVNLRRVVRCREEEEYLANMERQREEYEAKRAEDPSLPKYHKVFREKPLRVKADSHHFYIPEDLKYMADTKFDQKGATWAGAWIMVLIMAIALVAVLLSLPYILNLLDEFVGGFSSQNQTLT